MYDVFLSYAHTDLARVRKLRAALEARELKVWVDEKRIDTFDGITDSVSQGLRESKALLAFFSATYPTRRACQWELTEAFVRAQGLGDPRDRVLAVNPEDSFDHIAPVELRDSLVAHSPAHADMGLIAEAVLGKVSRLIGLLGQAPDHNGAEWYGRRPVAAARFVGRLSDMWQIHSGLAASAAGVTTGARGAQAVQVTGLGGVGKSLVAEEYALRFEAAYPGGVYWLRGYGHDLADGEPSAEARAAQRHEQLSQFGRDLGLTAEDLLPESVGAALAAELSRRGRPYLWIVDDLPVGLGADETRAYFAPSRDGSTLITTRSREYVSMGHHVPLGGLERSEGVELLCAQRTLDTPQEVESAAGLVDDLGGHPLALDITASALRVEKGTRSVAEYRAALANVTRDELELAAELSGELPNGHERSIAATLSRSLRQLDDAGMDFLRLAALLATHPIASALVRDVFVQLWDDETGPHRAAQASERCSQLSLADPVGGGAREVHTLVSRTVQFTDEALVRQLEVRRAAVAVLSQGLAAAGRSEAPDPDMAVHARHVLGTPFGLSSGAEYHPGEEVVLATALGVHDSLRADFRSALELQTEALEAARLLYGQESTIALEIDNSRALTLSRLGDVHEALDVLKRNTAVLRDRLGDGDVRCLGEMSNLGHALRAAGDLAGAVAILEVARASADRVLPRDDALRLSILNNLGQAQVEAGDVDKAIALLEEVVGASGNAPSAAGRTALTRQGNLGMALAMRGEAQRGRELVERTLEGCVTRLGDDDPLTLNTMDNLAYCHGLSEPRLAVTLLEQALDGHRRVQGDEHPDTIISLGNLGAVLNLLQETSRAAEVNAEALRLATKVLGKRHPGTLMAKQNLAASLGLGDPWGAWVLDQEVYLARQEVLGREHADTLMAQGNVAFRHAVLRDHDRASSMLDEVMRLAATCLREEHPTRHQIEQSQRALKMVRRTRPARPPYVEAVRRATDAWSRSGNDGSDTIRAMAGLAAAMLSKKQEAEAARAVSERIAHIIESTPSLDEGTTSATVCLGLALASRGYAEDARRLLKTLGDRPITESGDPATSVANTVRLARLLRATGEKERAHAILSAIVERSVRELGSEDVATLGVKLELAHATRDHGDPGGAVPLYAEIIGPARKLGLRHPIFIQSAAGVGRARRENRKRSQRD